MWILILYVGVSLQLRQEPVGGPATAEFASKQACESALAEFQKSIGEQRPFDQRLESLIPKNAPGDFQTRIWTVKGVCVPKQ